jgi:hypothetical protein
VTIVDFTTEKILTHDQKLFLNALNNNNNNNNTINLNLVLNVCLLHYIIIYVKYDNTDNYIHRQY